MHSLHRRLLLAASLVLAGFLGATGLALDRAFQVSAEDAIRDRLQSYIYGLLAAADEDQDGRISLSDKLPEPRLSAPDSGLYAVVAAADGRALWRSPSLTGRDLPVFRSQTPGEHRFQRSGTDRQPFYVLSFGVAWEGIGAAETLYTFSVAEDATAFESERQGFRTTLWGWLGGMALALLLAQGLILRWGLMPLRSVAADLRRIEQGAAERLEGAYPQELVGLTSNLNSLIEQGKTVQLRYRNSLDDLAHSLKTPLAILQTVAEEQSVDARSQSVLSEQVQRMDEIVHHQLRRAAVSGPTTLARGVEVAPVVERLVHSLDKVYREKQISVGLDLDPTVLFHGDQADLMEIVGNLLENAYKYGVSRVRVSVLCEPTRGLPPVMTLVVEDNGPGIDPQQAANAVQRGRRMDESVPGQGIGLAVAQEIVGVYGGSLEIGASDLGGARIRVRLS